MKTKKKLIFNSSLLSTIYEMNVIYLFDNSFDLSHTIIFINKTKQFIISNCCKLLHLRSENVPIEVDMK